MGPLMSVPALAHGPQMPPAMCSGKLRRAGSLLRPGRPQGEPQDSLELEASGSWTGHWGSVCPDTLAQRRQGLELEAGSGNEAGTLGSK